MDTSAQSLNVTELIDVHSLDFHISVQSETESDKARVKKSLEIIQDLRNTDYPSLYKFDYPTVYITPGQHEAYQKLYCLNPPVVNKAVTVVCDWVAPPQVQFTLGDEYMHVIRVDPSGRYLGNAVITTYQYCSHNNIPPHLANSTSTDENLPFIRRLRIKRTKTTKEMKLIT